MVLQGNTSIRYIPLVQTRSFFNDSIRTKKDGSFVLQKISSYGWAVPGLERPKEPPLSSRILVSKERYLSDTTAIYELESFENIKIVLYKEENQNAP